MAVTYDAMGSKRKQEEEIFADMRLPFIILAMMGVVCAGIFLAMPEIDLEISARFYREGQGFYLSHHPVIRAIYATVPWITRVIAVGSLLTLIASFVKPERMKKYRKQALYLIITMILGPGLLVNTVFKDHWGRARPHQVEQFGGNAHFSPPLVLSDQCERNCSFVSGHASMGFYLAALALLLPASMWLLRRTIYTFAVWFGLLVGYGRIVQGGHFLSDVVFSGIFTLMVVHLVYYFMFQRRVSD